MSAKRRGKLRNTHGKRKTATGVAKMIGAGNQGNPEAGVIAAAAIGRGAGADKEGTAFQTRWCGAGQQGEFSDTG
jgi:hypothetical protein